MAALNFRHVVEQLAGVIRARPVEHVRDAPSRHISGHVSHMALKL
jgi:hypothetical protein